MDFRVSCDTAGRLHDSIIADLSLRHHLPTSRCGIIADLSLRCLHPKIEISEPVVSEISPDPLLWLLVLVADSFLRHR